LLAIIHVFSCRMHGLRRYAAQIQKDPNLPHGATKADVPPVVRHRKARVQRNGGSAASAGQ
jgi:hypothetical protein